MIRQYFFFILFEFFFDHPSNVIKHFPKAKCQKYYNIVCNYETDKKERIKKGRKKKQEKVKWKENRTKGKKNKGWEYSYMIVLFN